MKSVTHNLAGRKRSFRHQHHQMAPNNPRNGQKLHNSTENSKLSGNLKEEGSDVYSGDAYSSQKKQMSLIQDQSIYQHNSRSQNQAMSYSAEAIPMLKNKDSAQKQEKLQKINRVVNNEFGEGNNSTIQLNQLFCSKFRRKRRPKQKDRTHGGLQSRITSMKVSLRLLLLRSTTIEVLMVRT